MRVFFSVGASQRGNLYFGGKGIYTLSDLGLNCTGARSETRGDIVSFGPTAQDLGVVCVYPKPVAEDATKPALASWLKYIPKKEEYAIDPISPQRIPIGVTALIEPQDASSSAYQLVMTDRGSEPALWSLFSTDLGWETQLVKKDGKLYIRVRDLSKSEEPHIYQSSEPGFAGLAQAIAGVCEFFRSAIEKAAE